MENCLFCKIVNEEVPCYSLYEDEQVIVFLDINPMHNGHTLVVPKTHCQDVFDIDLNDLVHVYEVAKKVANTLKEKLNCTGIRFVQNTGDLQEIKHYHLHLIPNYQKESKLPVEDVYNLITK